MPSRRPGFHICILKFQEFNTLRGQIRNELNPEDNDEEEAKIRKQNMMKKQMERKLEKLKIDNADLLKSNC